MKKTTKIFSLLFAFILCMGIMSVNVFAANYSKKTTDTASLPGYELYAYVRFYELVREVHVMSQVRPIDSTYSIDMELRTDITVQYADGSFETGRNHLENEVVGGNSSYLTSNLYFDLNTEKIVDVIYTHHGFFSDDENLSHYMYVDMYAGVDFPEEILE